MIVLILLDCFLDRYLWVWCDWPNLLCGCLLIWFWNHNLILLGLCAFLLLSWLVVGFQWQVGTISMMKVLKNICDRCSSGASHLLYLFRNLNLCKWLKHRLYLLLIWQSLPFNWSSASRELLIQFLLLPERLGINLLCNFSLMKRYPGNKTLFPFIVSKGIKRRFVSRKMLKKWICRSCPFHVCFYY